MGSGFMVAVAFMVINLIGAFFLWGGTGGLNLLILSLASSLSHFSLVAVPLFILMGEVMFHSEIAPNMLNALDKWFGRLPGRLAFLAVSGGVLFSTLTGESLASVAMLGKVLVPDMEKRGYKKAMTLGPILGSGGLAMLIPPSTLAVVLGAIGEIPIGRVLIAIIIPGLILAVLYAIYIITRCLVQPSLAPVYIVPPMPMSEKFVSLGKYVLPTGFIIFMVIGVMLLGVATPSEAAASGALGMFILAAAYKRLSLKVLKKSLANTLQITVMLFIIIAGASIFSRILAISGASRGLAEFAINVSVPPILIIITMQVSLLILGMFMEVVSIMMITLPLFVPLVETLGFDAVWFATIYLLNMEMATISPPFGLALFVMKGVAPPDTTISDIYWAALPFLGLGSTALALTMVFPQLALWLPSMMR
jgi:tripartite ATP-independent transporter DctM subunit